MAVPSQSAPLLRSPLARAGAVSAIFIIGLAACVPGNFRISGVGFSFGTNGVGFGIGGIGGLSSFSNGSGSSVDLDDPNDQSRLMAATFHNPIACDERIGLNWGQGFLDFATGACYACPEGYSRNDLTIPVTDGLACKQNGANLYQPAEALGPQGCTADTFQLDDACYSCPVGSVPSGQDDPGEACIATAQQTPMPPGAPGSAPGSAPVGAPANPGTSVTFN